MSTRTCSTKGCGTRFTPGRTGHGEHCARCQTTIARGDTPGPRKRAAPGQAEKTEKITAWLTEEQRAGLQAIQGARRISKPSEGDLIREAVDLLLKRARRGGLAC